MDRDGVEVHKNVKNKEKEPGQYLTILTEQAWSIKEFIMWLSNSLIIRAAPTRV